MGEDKKEVKKNIHKGHREKVKQSFFEVGLNGMAPHNILELLLFFGIPYKDTNPIAHDLIERFGSLSSVLEAKKSDLLQIKGMTENAACLLMMVLPLYRKYAEDVVGRCPKFSDIDETVDFLRLLYLDCNNKERVYALCFDASGYLINYRMLSEGDINSASVDLRNLAAFLLETNAASVLISHNHPHGLTSPSLDDINVTKNLRDFLLMLKVKFDDHIIVGDNSYFSMAKSYRFAHIFYNIDPIVEE